MDQYTLNLQQLNEIEERIARLEEMIEDLQKLIDITNGSNLAY